MASAYPRRLRSRGWSIVEYLAFVLAALGGLLFVVIPVHESIHYSIATLLGLRATMRVGLGWGFVTAVGATASQSLLIGSGPMLFEGFMSGLLLRRSAAASGSLGLGFGLAFTFDLVNAVANTQQSDFWTLWHMGFGTIVVLAILTTLALGVALGTPRRTPRPAVV